MACTNYKLTQDIVNDCTIQPVAGLRFKAWAFNRQDLTATKSNNIVTALTRASNTTSFTLEGFRDFLKYNSEAVESPGEPMTFLHNFALEAYARDAATAAALDKADDLVIVVELNGTKDLNSFIVLGVDNGLWKTTQTVASADNKGKTMAEFKTREGQGEAYSRYFLQIGGSYAATLAALVATETV